MSGGKTMAHFQLRRKSKKNAEHFVKNEKVYYIIPRKYARKLAKANMQKAGLKHINKYFRYHWRDYVLIKSR